MARYDETTGRGGSLFGDDSWQRDEAWPDAPDQTDDAADLREPPEPPEPSWFSDDSTYAGDPLGDTGSIPAYDLGVTTETVVVDLTGEHPVVSGVEETFVSRHAAPAPVAEAPVAEAAPVADARRRTRRRGGGPRHTGSGPVHPHRAHRAGAPLGPPARPGHRRQRRRVADRGHRAPHPAPAPADRLAQAGPERHWREGQPRPVRGGPAPRRPARRSAHAGARQPPGGRHLA